jgi:hypothetical protein
MLIYPKYKCGCTNCSNKRIDHHLCDILKLVYDAEFETIPSRFRSFQTSHVMERYIIGREEEPHYSGSLLKLISDLVNAQNNAIYVNSKKKELRCAYCGMQLCEELNDICSFCRRHTRVCSICKTPDQDTIGSYLEYYELPNGKEVLMCSSCMDRKGLEYCYECDKIHESVEMEKVVLGRLKRMTKYYHFCPKKTYLSTNCAGCHEVFRYQELQHYNGNRYCPICYDKREVIHNYDYTPYKLEFFKHDLEGTVSKDALHLGWELEIAEGIHDRHQLIRKSKQIVGDSRIWAMRDGSISDATGIRGVELVSHPFTWERYKRQDIPLWNDLLLYLQKENVLAENNGLGLHVHTTKSAWGVFQCYKLLNFIYNNSKFIERIARRKPTKYCRVYESDYENRIRVAKNKRNMGREHYNIINFNTSNGVDEGKEEKKRSKTIEFRMFQSTVEPLYFHGSLEFVHACWKFTKQYKEMSKDNFIKFLLQNDHNYSSLIELLRIQGEI